MLYLTGIAKYRYKSEPELCTGSSGSGDFIRKYFRLLSFPIWYLPLSHNPPQKLPTSRTAYLFSHRTSYVCATQPGATNVRPKQRKEKTTMSSKNNNKLNIPEARAAMDKFKMESAQEVGVNLKEGYNGDLTSREAGSVGGQMVKKMIESYEKNL